MRRVEPSPFGSDDEIQGTIVTRRTKSRVLSRFMPPTNTGLQPQMRRTETINEGKQRILLIRQVLLWTCVCMCWGMPNVPTSKGSMGASKLGNVANEKQSHLGIQHQVSPTSPRLTHPHVHSDTLRPSKSIPRVRRRRTWTHVVLYGGGTVRITWLVV
jgi:hypothetical protein